MSIKELERKLKPGIRIKVGNEEFSILEHIVWWQARSNENYDKYVLEDKSGNNEIRMFIAGDFIGMSKIIRHNFKEPLPKELEYEGKKYKLTQDEFCIVREAEGKSLYKVGDCEIWWDYTSLNNDGTGLSLGRNWQSWEREDLATRELSIKDIKILD